MKRIGLLFLSFVIVGCATLREAFPHVAALPVGGSGNQVLADVIHVLGKPVGGGTSPVEGKEGDEIEIRMFDYSETQRLGLYFYKGLFVQAVLIPVGKKELPDVRNDHRDILNSDRGRC